VAFIQQAPEIAIGRALLQVVTDYAVLAIVTSVQTRLAQKGHTKARETASANCVNSDVELVGSDPMTETSAIQATVPVAAYRRKTADAIAQKNELIQSVRGVAALFVALFHASVYCGRQFGQSGWATAFDGRFGLVGVAVFFTISGLLMADLIQRTDPWRFLAHRMVRIYPPYLLAVAVSLLLIAGHLTSGALQFHFFSLMLVPAGPRPYYLGVEWTLVLECTYYLALFLIALLGWQHYLNSIALFWLLVIAAASYFWSNGGNLLYPIYSIWLSAANVAFIGGLLIPRLSRTPIPVGTGILALCILMATTLPANLMIDRWIAGVVATLFVLDLVRVQVPRRALLVLPKLGDWSYALYLCHVPWILLVYYWWPSSTAAGMAWFVAVASALAIAAAFGTLDVRMYRQFKSAIDDAGEQQRRRLVNIYATAFVIASLIALAIV
jgi:exopolysaccharide production protein ExoZ